MNLKIELLTIQNLQKSKDPGHFGHKNDHVIPLPFLSAFLVLKSTIIQTRFLGIIFTHSNTDTTEIGNYRLTFVFLLLWWLLHLHNVRHNESVLLQFELSFWFTTARKNHGIEKYLEIWWFVINTHLEEFCGIFFTSNTFLTFLMCSSTVAEATATLSWNGTLFVGLKCFSINLWTWPIKIFSPNGAILNIST